MNLKLFYSPPKWKAFIAPEYIDDMYHVENRLNEKAYAEAKANALEVANYELIFETVKNYAEVLHGIHWPGDAVIKDGKYILSI